jgi:hypothetical protein
MNQYAHPKRDGTDQYKKSLCLFSKHTSKIRNPWERRSATDCTYRSFFAVSLFANRNLASSMSASGWMYILVLWSIITSFSLVISGDSCFSGFFSFIFPILLKKVPVGNGTPFILMLIGHAIWLSSLEKHRLFLPKSNSSFIRFDIIC